MRKEESAGIRGNAVQFSFCKPKILEGRHGELRGFRPGTLIPELGGEDQGLLHVGGGKVLGDPRSTGHLGEL